jgi:glutathione S-transferase
LSGSIAGIRGVFRILEPGKPGGLTLTTPSAKYRLLIGDKAWSSWSFRPWLLMTAFGVPFTEIAVRLRQPGSKAEILKHSPAGKVPALFVGDLLVWDSLAIIETIADRHPELAIWPKDPDARAVARAVSAEMHAGFQQLREHCPMDILNSKPMETLPDTVELNVRRIIACWSSCRTRFGAGGPFLFGQFSAADAMYAPVASRFKTYIPDLAKYGDDGTAAHYVSAIFAMPEMAAWEAAAARERAPA